MLNVGSSWVDTQCIKFVLTKQVPSMKASAGVYMFPSEEGYFGLKFGKSTPEEKFEQFENLLKTFSAFSEASDVLALRDTKADTNMAVTETADTGVDMINKGKNVVNESIATVSKTAGIGVRWAAKYIKKQIKPNETPMEVSDTAKFHATKLKQMGGVAVTFSKSMVTGAVATASNLSTTLYQQGKGTQQGAKIEKVMQDPKAQAAAKVAVVSASAAWEIYLAMAQAGVQFVQDVADATADVVEHKYGADAGKATSDGLSALTQGVVAMNVMNNAPYTAVAEGIVGKQAANVQDGVAPQPAVEAAPEAKPTKIPAAATPVILGGLD